MPLPVQSAAYGCLRKQDCRLMLVLKDSPANDVHTMYKNLEMQPIYNMPCGLQERNDVLWTTDSKGKGCKSYSCPNPASVLSVHL